MNKKFLPNAVLSRSTNAGGVMPTIHPGPRRLRLTGRFSAAFLILAGFARPSANIAIAAILIAGGGLIAAKDMLARR